DDRPPRRRGERLVERGPVEVARDERARRVEDRRPRGELERRLEGAERHRADGSAVVREDVAERERRVEHRVPDERRLEEAALDERDRGRPDARLAVAEEELLRGTD